MLRSAHIIYCSPSRFVSGEVAPLARVRGSFTGEAAGRNAACGEGTATQPAIVTSDHSRRPPPTMKPDGHAMVEMRPRNRPTLNLLRIENREMTRISIFIKNIRQQISFALS